MTADCLFFLAFGAVYGGLVGWWWRGRRERRRNAPAVVAPLLAMIEQEVARRQTPEEWRRARLAYDVIYDEHREKRA